MNKKNNKKIQIILIFFGIMLIIVTYFIYPQLTQENLEKIEDKKIETLKDKDVDEDTLFTNVEYKGITSKGSPYVVSSEFASMDPDNPDIVNMKFITATYHYKDGRTIIITSDEGQFNKISGDIAFQKNVKMIDSEYNKLTSENLDMLISEDYAAAYDNVTLTTMNGQFVIADKIKFDSIKKTFKISMLEKDKKIKVKLIK